MNKHLLFVYGTLRRGGVNALPARFPGARFVGEARVGGRLYDLGEYPGLLVEEGGAPVVGEVYEVDDDALKELDAYEATAEYRRRPIELPLGDRAQPCWVYEPPAEACRRRELITSGDWIEYAGAKGGAD